MAQFDDIDYSYLGVEGLKGDRPVRVTNVARRKVSYVLPELNDMRRDFPPAPISGKTEPKVITFHELYLLQNSPGGAKLIFENLQIRDNDVRVALDLPTDPEFDYDLNDIEKLMTDGTKEQILDALDFGPFYIAQWMKNALVTKNLSINYDKVKFFETLFRMKLDNVKENFEWAKDDPQIGREYRAMEKANEGAGRQRRAGTTTENANNRDEQDSAIRSRRAPLQ